MADATRPPRCSWKPCQSNAHVDALLRCPAAAAAAAAATADILAGMPVWPLMHSRLHRFLPCTRTP